MTDTQEIPGLLHLVGAGTIEAAAISDIEDIDYSPHVVKNMCSKCEQISYEPMFKMTRVEDGSFPDESKKALLSLVQEHRGYGYKHVPGFYGMVIQCPECAAK